MHHFPANMEKLPLSAMAWQDFDAKNRITQQRVGGFGN